MVREISSPRPAVALLPPFVFSLTCGGLFALHTAHDKQKVLLSSDAGHFSLIRAMHLADLITELNGEQPLSPRRTNPTVVMEILAVAGQRRLLAFCFPAVLPSTHWLICAAFPPF